MKTINVSTPDRLYLTSDNHYHHFNICRYCNRPFGSAAEMDDVLTRNWNSTVPADGIVICCGDFMLNHKSGVQEYFKVMRNLNFRDFFLVRGNHDRIDLGTYDIDWPEREMCTLTIVDMLRINVENVSILACHYPILAYPTDYQIFGHVHTLSAGTCSGRDKDVPGRLRPTQYDVGVDQNGYTPISYGKLMEIFKSR